MPFTRAWAPWCKCGKSVLAIPQKYFAEAPHRYLHNPVLFVSLKRQILGGWVFSADVTNGAFALTQSEDALCLFYNSGPLCDWGLRLGEWANSSVSFSADSSDNLRSFDFDFYRGPSVLR